MRRGKSEEGSHSLLSRELLKNRLHILLSTSRPPPCVAKPLHPDGFVTGSIEFPRTPPNDRWSGVVVDVRIVQRKPSLLERGGTGWIERRVHARAADGRR